jgi:uronate dehydrogenase
MQRILITGAAGGVGSQLTALLHDTYELRLSDIRTPAAVPGNAEFIPAELSNMAAVGRVVAGMDGIVHLGGLSVEGPWETILQTNITGCYNLFEAARRAKVRRIVFASSNHAVGFYPRRRKIGTDVPVRPDSRYGVSKAFGEALGALYAYKHGMRVTCLRIGNVADAPVDRRRLAIWVRPEDLAQLVRIGLEHPGILYEIFYGASDNERAWWDNTAAHRYGYRPQFRAEDYRDEALAKQAALPADPVGDWYQGGPFCSAEYDGDEPAGF